VRIKRLGRDGRPFGLLKLRSMTRDADRMKEALRHLNTMAWPDFKIADDPRVTRLGRVLRKYSLDELPQLYNVLRGEMTLVGPRPCSVKLADYDLWQSERLDVTPGLVGRWQAEGRGTMDFADRCRLDIHQARSRSIRLNLQLVVATIRSVFVSKGAY
jgi:lipopolysaccharide/colanic/teichoic acid biosynthesis glycosyltransferase